MKLTSSLYRAARLLRNVEVITSGNPKKMARRVKNIVVGRTIFRRINRW